MICPHTLNILAPANVRPGCHISFHVRIPLRWRAHAGARRARSRRPRHHRTSRAPSRGRKRDLSAAPRTLRADQGGGAEFSDGPADVARRGSGQARRARRARRRDSPDRGAAARAGELRARFPRPHVTRRLSHAAHRSSHGAAHRRAEARSERRHAGRGARPPISPRRAVRRAPERRPHRALGWCVAARHRRQRADRRLPPHGAPRLR